MIRFTFAGVAFLIIACNSGQNNFLTKEDSLEIQKRLGISESNIISDNSPQIKNEQVRAKSREIIDRDIHEFSIDGDFDGDGLFETIWVVSDYKEEDGTTCKTHLKSNVNIIPKHDWDACSTGIRNINDINGDGADDLYVNHWGAIGNTNFVGVMSLSKAGKWYYSVEEFRCMGDSEKLRVRKVRNGVMISYNGGEETGDVVQDAWAEHEKFIKPKCK